MDHRTKELTKTYSDDIDTLYISRKEGGRRLSNMEDCVDAIIQRLGEYIYIYIKGKEGLITAVNNNNNINRILAK